MIQQGLLIEWIDPRGRIWDLGTGTEGVLLDENQEGLGMSAVTHNWVRGDTMWAGMKLERARPSLRVNIGHDLYGQEWYQVAEEWWTQANSFTTPGILRFTRIDGEIREMRCRLREAPSTSYRFDPGRSFRRDSDTIEAWLLDGDSPYWQGKEQKSSFGIAVVEGRIEHSTPFFGEQGRGWPLYVSQPVFETTGDGSASFSNKGQGGMWLTWTLQGPLTNPRFGVEGAVLAYSGTISRGETVVVTTEPGFRTVTLLEQKASRFEKVSGQYAPLPVGEDIPLIVGAEGMDTKSKITVSGRPQYLRPF